MPKQYENENAQFVVQSHWLRSNCDANPDLITGSSNIFTSIAFSGLLEGGLGYCGGEFLYDCTHNGICAASLNINLTYGYQSFADTYMSTAPISLTQWVFPEKLNQGIYCTLSSFNNSILLLSESPLCYHQTKCIENRLEIYSDSQCSQVAETFLLGNNAVSIQINNINYNAFMYTITNGVQPIVWTTFITDKTTVLSNSEPLWFSAFFMVVCAIALILTHLTIAIGKYRTTKRYKYAVFVVAYLFAISECIMVIFASLEGYVDLGYTNLAYGLVSCFNFGLNGLCLMEIVFRGLESRIQLTLLLAGIYVALGSPYLFCVYFVNDQNSLFGRFINFYFDTYSYPIWQIVCFAFDPITAIIIITYIVRVSLSSKQDKWYPALKLVFKDTKLRWISLVSIVNVLSSLFLQVATTYTLYAKNDKMMIFYECVFNLQHSVNLCCTFWYSFYFPLILRRMLTLRDEEVTASSLQNQKPNKKLCTLKNMRKATLKTTIKLDH
ncbi:hypothetical protein HDV04_003305 [Boothiomyces sp. JEL0838]|nr:hypothetical protein HDV04_003305 [Boothiomyces sp. JEL0838]